MTIFFIVQRQEWMKTHSYLTDITPVNQSPYLTKERFAWINFNYVIFSASDVNNTSCLQVWPGTDIREVKIDVYGRPVTANGKLQFAFEGKFYKFSKVSTSF